MTKITDIPAIRFKGFSDTWEQRKFGEVFDCTVPNNTLSRAELSYDEGTVLNVHYGDVLIKYGSVLDVQKDDIPRIPHRCREDFNGALLQDGDVIIADTAEDETTGKACEIGNLQGSAIVSGLHTMVCRPRNRMALGYLGYYLNSNAYHHQLLPLMQGIKVLSLSRSNIQKTSVSYPSAMKEQQLIASYFSQLDHLITLHQRKYDKLTNVKKSMLEKMFPQNGSNVPEIRFKGFTEAWEQRKLGEICSRVQGNDGRMELPTLTISAANGWMKQEDRFSGNIAGKEQKNYTLLHKGELSYNHGNSKLAKYGTVFSLQTYEEALVPRVYHSFKVEIGSADFIEYYFATKMPDRELRRLISSGARMDGLLNIGYDDFMSIKMMFPSVLEQDKIAEYFRAFDHLITLHQRELEKLKNLKKACLEKMFV